MSDVSPSHFADCIEQNEVVYDIRSAGTELSTVICEER